MRAAEALRAIMEKKGVRFTTLMDRLGVKSNTLANRLNQENMSVKVLNDMARVMDYKIVLVPREARVGQDAYEVE